MEVTLREIFDWNFMQTDPNFANFFYNPNSEVVYLLDFGAAKQYDTEFCKKYLETVHAAANNEPLTILRASTELGFLTGDESEVMRQAHIESVLIVGQPFSKPGNFYFGNQTMTRQLLNLMPVMLKNRLKPPWKTLSRLRAQMAATCSRGVCGRRFYCVTGGSSVYSLELFDRVCSSETIRNSRGDWAAAGGGSLDTVSILQFAGPETWSDNLM